MENSTEESKPVPETPTEEQTEVKSPRRKQIPVPPPIETSSPSPRSSSGSGRCYSPRMSENGSPSPRRSLQMGGRPNSAREFPQRRPYSPRSPRSNSNADERLSLYRNSTDAALAARRRPSDSSAPVSPRLASPRMNNFRRSMPIFKIPESGPEIQKYKEQALNKKLPLDLSQGTYDDIVYALANDRKNLAAKHNFEKSDKCNEAIKYVKECQIQAAKNELQKKVQQENQEKNQEIVKELEKFDEDSKRLLKELLATEKKMRAELEQQHEKEITENEQLWTSDVKLKNYNAPTNALMSLKKQINLLTVQCRFKEASVVTKEYQRQKAHEEKESFAQMQHDYDEALTKILDRQKEELKAFDAQTEIRVKHFEVTRGKERKAIENKLQINKNTAETAQDPEKLWAKTNVQRAQINEGPLNASTKLTRKDIADSDFELLTLPPLDLKRKK